MKKWPCILGVCLPAVILSGCAAVVVEGAKGGLNSKVRSDYTSAANAGDPEAQFKVGKSYCCSLENVEGGYYNTQTATEYLCKAAKQGHGGAAFMLGEIHSGKRAQGASAIRKLGYAAVPENQVNKQLAYYWYSVAAQNQSEDAVEVLGKIPPQDISSYSNPNNTVCTMKEAYPNT